MDREVRYATKIPMMAPRIVPNVRTTVLMVAEVLADASDLSSAFWMLRSASSMAVTLFSTQLFEERCR